MPPAKAVTRAEFDALTKEVEAIKEQVGKTHKYLFGNGEKIGVDEQLRNILKFLEIRKDWEKWTLRAIVGFMLLTFVDLSLRVLEHLAAAAVP